MSEVVSLFGHPTGERKPSAPLIEMLEDMLERARAGDVIGGGLVCVHADGSASWTIAGRVGGYSALGALEMIRAELVEINRE